MSLSRDVRLSSYYSHRPQSYFNHDRSSRSLPLCLCVISLDIVLINNNSWSELGLLHRVFFMRPQAAFLKVIT
jgi:hypothetical protein